MATIDKRAPSTKMFLHGSDIGMAVLLSAAEALDIYGAGSAAGYYVPWTFEGGTIQHITEPEYDEDESAQLTGKIIENADRFVVENVIKETDDRAQDLIDKYLSKSAHKYRYALPAGTVEVDDGQGGTETQPGHQLYGLYNGIVQSGYQISTAKGKRTRPIQIASSRYLGKPSHVRRTVYMGDQATWPAEMDDFKDPV